jgi:hypothetical protein
MQRPSLKPFSELPRPCVASMPSISSMPGCARPILSLMDKVNPFSPDSIGRGSIQKRLSTGAQSGPIWELTTGPARSMEQIIMRVSRGARFARQGGVPDPLWNLICQCWHPAADNRPTFAEITRAMMKSDDYMFERTDLGEYHEYGRAMTRPSSQAQPLCTPTVLAQLRSLGLDITSLHTDL